VFIFLQLSSVQFHKITRTMQRNTRLEFHTTSITVELFTKKSFKIKGFKKKLESPPPKAYVLPHLTLELLKKPLDCIIERSQVH